MGHIIFFVLGATLMLRMKIVSRFFKIAWPFALVLILVVGCVMPSSHCSGKPDGAFDETMVPIKKSKKDFLPSARCKAPCSSACWPYCQAVEHNEVASVASYRTVVEDKAAPLRSLRVSLSESFLVTFRGNKARLAKKNNKRIWQLLMTDSEADPYDPALDVALQQLALTELYAPVFSKNRTLLHCVARDPTHLHTQGVAAYINYLSQHSRVYQQRCVRAFVHLFEEYYPEDILSLIVTYIPHQLDVEDGAGKSAIDYAYEELTYAYPLLREHGAHHSNQELARRIRAHLQTNAPPYEATLQGRALLQAAIVQGDIELVWLLLGQLQRFPVFRPNYWYEAERLVNARFNCDRHLPLKPGYNLVGYCTRCQRIGISCWNFVHEHVHQVAMQRYGFRFYNLVPENVREGICPVCDHRMEALNMPYFILLQCRYTSYLGYRFCCIGKHARITAGVIGDVPRRVYTCHFPKQKGTFFKLNVSALS